MKKILSLLIGVILVLSFTACKSNKTNTVEHIVIYDYGTYNEGKATLLLDGTLPYFAFDEYDIATVLAGDIIKVTYNGEMEILYTYPGTVEDKNLKIVDVEITPAEIIEFDVQVSESDGKADLIPVDDKYNFYILMGDVKNVLNEDMTFKPYTELPSGTKVYATIQDTEEGITVCGLYSFKPR